MKKDTKEIVEPQMDRYRKEGFPEDYGLLQSNIMIRKHNESNCIKFMEEWFNEVKNGSHRDQLSFNYVSWKNKNIKIIYLPQLIFDSQWFKWAAIHSKKHNSNVKRNENNAREGLKSINLRKRLTNIGNSNLEHKSLKTSDISIY